MLEGLFILTLNLIWVTFYEFEQIQFTKIPINVMVFMIYVFNTLFFLTIVLLFDLDTFGFVTVKNRSVLSAVSSLV